MKGRGRMAQQDSLGRRKRLCLILAGVIALAGWVLVAGQGTPPDRSAVSPAPGRQPAGSARSAGQIDRQWSRQLHRQQ